jgi:invasion protein IalB
MLPVPRRDDEITTRRRILQAGFALAGGTVAIGPARAADTAQPAAPMKFTPEAVHYQATPNDWQKCVFCQYFKEPTTCGILTEPVTKNGWCDHFALLHE